MVSGSITFVAASNQSINIPYNAVIDNFSALTLSCWVYRTSISGSYVSFIEKGYPTAGWFDLQEDPSGNAYISAGGTVTTPSAATSYTNTSWHHLCGTWDGSNLNLYIDGVLKAGPTSAVSGSVSLNAALFIVGGISQSFNGNVTDARIYNVALTHAEVNSLFVGHNIARGLVTEFPFPEGSGTTTTDSVNNLVGTLTNGPTWSTNIPNAFKATHFTYRYVYSPQAYQSSNTNAISDTFKINNDQTWAGGPNDDQYYTFGLFIGPTAGSLTGAVPVNLNLTLSYTSSTPSINFTALYNGVIQNTFLLPVIVGHIYKRQIIFTPGIGSDRGIAGDSVAQNPTITYIIADNTTLGHYQRIYSFTYTPTTLPNNSRFIQAFSGTEWWTFSTFPFNLEYNVSVTDFAYSLDGGTTYHRIQGSDLMIKTDGKYNVVGYPIQNYNLIMPGQLPVVGGR